MSAAGTQNTKPTIVLIHGLWLTPRSWEGWIDRYQKAGYNVLAPSWPGLEGEVEAIRKDPHRSRASSSRRSSIITIASFASSTASQS